RGSRELERAQELDEEAVVVAPTTQIPEPPAAQRPHTVPHSIEEGPSRRSMVRFEAGGTSQNVPPNAHMATELPQVTKCLPVVPVARGKQALSHTVVQTANQMEIAFDEDRPCTAPTTFREFKLPSVKKSASRHFPKGSESVLAVGSDSVYIPAPSSGKISEEMQMFLNLKKASGRHVAAMAALRKSPDMGMALKGVGMGQRVPGGRPPQRDSTQETGRIFQPRAPAQQQQQQQQKQQEQQQQQIRSGLRGGALRKFGSGKSAGMASSSINQNNQSSIRFANMTL
ncbi:hypothetical protein CYMTET_19299, partial [Cymbomonas tetramitiformis]